MGTAVCPFCGKKVDTFIMFRGDVVGCKFCGIHTKPITNADRIRAMSDDELAKLLFERGNCGEYCYGICSYQDECNGYPSEKFCISKIVEWLKKEVEE